MHVHASITKCFIGGQSSLSLHWLLFALELAILGSFWPWTGLALQTFIFWHNPTPKQPGVGVQGECGLAEIPIKCTMAVNALRYNEDVRLSAYLAVIVGGVCGLGINSHRKHTQYQIPLYNRVNCTAVATPGWLFEAKTKIVLPLRTLAWWCRRHGWVVVWVMCVMAVTVCAFVGGGRPQLAYQPACMH